MTDQDHNSGALTRVSIRSSGATADEPVNVAPPELNRVHTGAIRHTFGSSQVEDIGHASHTVTQDGVRGGSAMATLRTDGPSHSVELEPGNPSSRTSVEVACRLGVLRKIGPGLYEDVSGKAQALQGPHSSPAVLPGPAAEPQDLPGIDPGVEIFNAEDDARLAEILDPVPQFAFDAALASGKLAAIRGSDLSGVAKSFSQATGMDPQQAAEMVEAVGAHFERSVMAAVTAAGVGPSQHEAWRAYARENPGKLQEALGLMLDRRDPSGFFSLAHSFKRANPGDLSAWHAAGFEASMGDDAQLLVKRPGGEWRRARDLK